LRANETEVVAAGRDVDAVFWIDFVGEAAFVVCGCKQDYDKGK